MDLNRPRVRSLADRLYHLTNVVDFARLSAVLVSSGNTH